MVKNRRMATLLLIDIIIIWFSIYTSYLLRFNYLIPTDFRIQMLVYGLVSTIVCGACMIGFRMYRRIWQYASVGEIIAITKAVAIGCILSFVIMLFFSENRVPLSIGLLTLETMLILMGGIRFVWRVLRNRRSMTYIEQTNVLIVGAGDCGAMIAKDLMNQAELPWQVVGFIDDDLNKFNHQVMGHPVLGNRLFIPKLVEKYKVAEIVIAIPSAPKQEITEIINICKVTGARLKMIPAIKDLLSGKVSLNTIRDVEVEDLLGREPVIIDLDDIAGYVQNKIVLVTGAGGSIGSELSRQIASFKPKTILLLGHGENSIYTIEMELRRTHPELHIEPLIADIQDRQRMEDVFQEYRPQVVFHAAAHKHVPLMERNPSEAVKNNVFGTKNVADCANKYGTERFVMISSDKAVNPTSVMGATKRIAEMYVQSLGAQSKTIFAAVRFGNVLGSRGSVIPRFKEQIAMGGPVTVTHPDMVRFFMTIPEAVQLVIQAGSLAKGGEIFILDMGEPVRIVELAEDLIRLSGFEPYEEIPIAFSGIRDGEKLFEEMLSMEEIVTATKHDRIHIGKPVNINQAELDLEFKRLEKHIIEENSSVRDVIERLVPMHVNVS